MGVEVVSPFVLERLWLDCRGTMGLFRVFVSLLALASLAVTPVLGQRSDGRIELNLGYLTSESGRFASYGERCGTGCLVAVYCLESVATHARMHTRHLRLYVMYPRMYCIADVLSCHRTHAFAYCGACCGLLLTEMCLTPKTYLPPTSLPCRNLSCRKASRGLHKQ